MRWAFGLLEVTARFAFVRRGTDIKFVKYQRTVMNFVLLNPMPAVGLHVSRSVMRVSSSIRFTFRSCSVAVVGWGESFIFGRKVFGISRCSIGCNAE